MSVDKREVSGGPSELDLARPLVVGFGVTNRALVSALIKHGFEPVVIDDKPTSFSLEQAALMNVEIITTPDGKRLWELVSGASVLLPSPGIPDHHPVFAAATDAGLTVASEFDLSQAWDNRPLIAITGTNGKTTVTMMVTDALCRSGIRAEAVGNTEIPLVSAIEGSEVDAFVVEASSFRLDHSLAFKPAVATWLNFSPDHLDAHESLARYENAKASVWANHGDSTTAIVNDSDPVIASHRPRFGNVQGFGTPDSDWRVQDDHLVGPASVLGSAAPGCSLQHGSVAFARIEQLTRTQPHDLDNALAAAATAFASGASIEGVREMLYRFEGLPHRLNSIGTFGGVPWYDDSKATVPHATLAAVGGFESVVLIAGGRNKGLDLAPLKEGVPPIKAVVAIGDASKEIEAVFDGLAPCVVGLNMSQAVEQAAAIARSGDVVILSPACTSFDWYPNYKERGLDFVHQVNKRFSE